MPVSAIVEDNEAEFEEADPHVTLALCDLLEEAGAGRLTLIELARRLGELTAAAPEHIDARAHLGSVLMKCERLQEAAAEYERAFELGSRALPPPAGSIIFRTEAEIHIGSHPPPATTRV